MLPRGTLRPASVAVAPSAVQPQSQLSVTGWPTATRRTAKASEVLVPPLALTSQTQGSSSQAEGLPTAALRMARASDVFGPLPVDCGCPQSPSAACPGSAAVRNN